MREWVAIANGNEAWRQTADDVVKVLVIVHRMAATRLGFGDLYAALNDKAPDAFKNGFLDASAWPVRPLMQFALPLSDALRNSREFEAMSLLREHCGLLKKEELRGKNVQSVLGRLREASLCIERMMRPEEGCTIREVLTFIRDSELMGLDPRILAYLEQQLPPADEDAEPDEEEAGNEVSAMEAFLACPAAELWGYNALVDSHHSLRSRESKALSSNASSSSWTTKRAHILSSPMTNTSGSNSYPTAISRTSRREGNGDRPHTTTLLCLLHPCSERFGCGAVQRSRARGGARSRRQYLPRGCYLERHRFVIATNRAR